MANVPPTGAVKEIRKVRSNIIVDLAGEVDLHRTPELRVTLSRLIAERPAVLVVNLANVTYMDSSGVATLVEALQHMRRSDGTLCLAAMTPRVKSVFEIARLDTVFPIFADEAEALK